MDGGGHSIDFVIISDKSKVWSKSFTQKNNDAFAELIRVPLEGIDTSDLRLKIEVSKGRNITSKSYPFEVKNDFLMLSSVKNISTALEQMNYILTVEERKELRGLKNSQKEKFFKKVWAKRDPDATTKENELLVEYYKRVAFAEQNFSRGTSGGWRSDMGMIYILFGKPDDISRSMNSQQSYNFQTWYYYQINEEFLFIDDYGFGDYRLRTPFLY
jgi:GWxTD domain-containing protein